MGDLQCKLCGRTAPSEEYLEKHHLIPKNCRGKLKLQDIPKLQVCVDCADQLHQLFSEKELRDRYNTVEALFADERVWKWVKWIRKQERFGLCHKEKKRRR